MDLVRNSVTTIVCVVDISMLPVLLTVNTVRIMHVVNAVSMINTVDMINTVNTINTVNAAMLQVNQRHHLHKPISSSILPIHQFFHHSSIL